MTLRRILTQKEHIKHIHLCGKTGAEIDGAGICKKCGMEKSELFKQCIQSHAVIDWDEDVTEEQIERLFKH